MNCLFWELPSLILYNYFPIQLLLFFLNIVVSFFSTIKKLFLCQLHVLEITLPIIYARLLLLIVFYFVHEHILTFLKSNLSIFVFSCFWTFCVAKRVFLHLKGIHTFYWSCFHSLLAPPTHISLTCVFVTLKPDVVFGSLINPKFIFICRMVEVLLFQSCISLLLLLW